MNEEPRNSKIGGVGSEMIAFVWEVLKIVLISLAIIIPIRYYLVQPFFVNGHSMDPNFHDKDYILVDKLGYRLHPPQRGDVIVLRYPLEPSEYFIKRIIALPGETIQVKNNVVTIYNKEYPDGFRLDESVYLASDLSIPGDGKWTLDTDDYFVMGDNRPNSSDSRRWGLLHRPFISGRAWIRLWPFSSAGLIQHAKYPQPNL
jgi:signal peptidase I